MYVIYADYVVYGGCCGIIAGSQGTKPARRESNSDVIFLSTDHHQILTRDRDELLDALINELDLDDDVAMRKLAAAYLGCEVEGVVWVEV